MIELTHLPKIEFEKVPDTYKCFDYDTEYNSWKDACGDVIAWKEIIFPEEIK